MRLPLTALVAAIVAFAVPAQAAEPADSPLANPDKIYDSVTLEGVVEILREMGAQQVEIKEAGGQKSILMVDGGVPYNVATGLCDKRPGKCLVLGILVMVENGSGGYPLDALNVINKNNMFVTLFKEDSAKFGVSRLQLVDGGVTKRNLVINIASFVATFREAMQQLSTQTIAGYQYGSGRYQRASFGQTQIRPVVATPREMQEFVGQMGSQYRTTLRRPR